MKVFVDVGSHEGQTIEEVVKPEWGFDSIFALEPMPEQFRACRRAFQADHRVSCLNLALGDKTGYALMYGDNENLGASLFQDKDDVNPQRQTAVDMMDARGFFEGLPESDLYVNMNCEGGELPILTRLLESGSIKRIKALLVDFDILKVPGHEADVEDLRSGLDMSGITWTCEYPLVDEDATHQEQIAQWLRGVM